ncbi:hypothetical protein HC251_02680 [Iamia sp. SCSIO 61187]|uniref:hypothetical protein n=1 Tax=Iamia sp. SCSIO 61187 TaxID=2722752 RepID=UPI001C63A157|nr:hypothetical protein [Iamia sp. SCSIO 61187]QYG90955.1 hypothetical protein HC251_02680 [Iamia sp. SCSIO 61187]
MADDTRPDLEKVHPRPDQAEEPADDVGASNVDLDEARHGPAHVSPSVPEPGHEPDAHGHGHAGHDVHGHDDHGHDDHGDHPVESPTWVLAPVVVGLLIGVVLIIVLGLSAGATPFHTL